MKTLEELVQKVVDNEGFVFMRTSGNSRRSPHTLTSAEIVSLVAAGLLVKVFSRYEDGKLYETFVPVKLIPELKAVIDRHTEKS